ncbi:hypothetical protein [Neptuniibacter sp. QD37_11]|uniref:hypothetical protein n=1 Tax=Neptuniibacter sp. QD37_11 TaxID=3398209 RepID=UPI0039F48412
MSVFDSTLRECLVNFFENTDERKRLMFVDMYGLFTDKPKSGSEIAREQGLSRERVRQITDRVMECYIASLPFSGGHVLEAARESFATKYEDLFPETRSLFHNTKGFEKFYFRLTGQQEFLTETRKLGSNPLGINNLFSAYGDSLTVKGFAYKLDSVIDRGNVTTDYVQWLVNKGVIALKDGRVVPVKVPLSTAIPYILYNHPDGLTVEEAYHQLKSTKEIQVRAEALKSLHKFKHNNGNCVNHCDYFIARQIMKHVRHSHLSDREFEVCSAIREHIAKHNRSMMYLDYIFEAISPSLPDVSYEDVRHFLRSSNNALGIHFYSVPAADIVSLGSLEGAPTQKDMLFDIIKRSGTPVCSDYLKAQMRNATRSMYGKFLAELESDGDIEWVDGGYQVTEAV